MTLHAGPCSAVLREMRKDNPDVYILDDAQRKILRWEFMVAQLAANESPMQHALSSCRREQVGHCEPEIGYAALPVFRYKIWTGKRHSTAVLQGAGRPL